MTEIDNHGYDQLLEGFGQQLDAAAAGAEARRGRAKRRSRGAAGVGLLLLGGADSGQLDVVAQARAALAPSNEIVHLVTTTHLGTAGGPEPRTGAPAVTEQWSAAAPPRWRVAIYIPTPTRTPGGKPVRNLDGLVTGHVQVSYANGTEAQYFQQVNTLQITTGLSDQGQRRSPDGPFGVEPVAQIRSMIEAGQLHDAGNGSIDGRAIRRLVGEAPHGARWTRGATSRPPAPIEYDVDASSYAPVRITIDESRTREPVGVKTPVEVIDVDTYELIPLNSTTASLLTIKPAGKPTVRHYRGG
jgi:hypothetical protein